MSYVLNASSKPDQRQKRKRFAQVLADQDWISFRPNVFALQDLASKWTERIKARLAEAQRADTVTEHIHEVSKTV